MRARSAPVAAVVIVALTGGTNAALAEGLSGQLHTVTAANHSCASVCQTTLAGAWSVDQDSSTISFVTENWNPPGHVGTYYDSPVQYGSQLVGSDSQYYIEGSIGMPNGAAFNLLTVRYFDDHPCVFFHGASVTNTVGDSTYLSHPDLDNHPGAFLIAQPILTNSRNVGVRYDAGLNRWAIFNEDQSAMPNSGHQFVVWDATCNIGISGLYTVTCPSSSGDDCLLSGVEHGNRSAQLLVTQRWTSVYNPHNIGVYYNVLDNNWYVFNEDQAQMPTGAQFNVAVVRVLLETGFEDPGAWLGLPP